MAAKYGKIKHYQIRKMICFLNVRQFFISLSLIKGSYQNGGTFCVFKPENKTVENILVVNNRQLIVKVLWKIEK